MLSLARDGFGLKIHVPALHKSQSPRPSGLMMHRIDIFFPFVLPTVKDIGG
jgi:hypothetical protein